MISITDTDIQVGRVLNISVESIAVQVGVPLDAWPGNCYGIAVKLVESGVIEGRPVYGHYLGPVSPECKMFYGKAIVPHGWVETDEDTGTIVDPTRWVFENAKPYLHVSTPPDELVPACTECGALEDEHPTDENSFGDPACDDFVMPEWDYDEGGNALREQMMTPSPEWRDDDVQYEIALELPWQVLVDGLLGGHHDTVSRSQAFWLANLPLSALGPAAEPLYRAMVEAGLVALLPIDNRTKILGE